MKNILEDLEILILQNEDDFDRGSGKFILRNFIKEKKSEQLTLTDVVKPFFCLKKETVIGPQKCDKQCSYCKMEERNDLIKEL